MANKVRQKQQVRDKFYTKYFDGTRTNFKASDLPPNLLPDDLIEFESWEAYYGSDSSHDGGSELNVYRYRLETDAEFEDRCKHVDELLANSKEERRKKYLELKKEFENE